MKVGEEDDPVGRVDELVVDPAVRQVRIRGSGLAPLVESEDLDQLDIRLGTRVGRRFGIGRQARLEPADRQVHGRERDVPSAQVVIVP